MKHQIENKLKTNKGITLIALVISIIVLLILAGVTISALSGENGILQRSTDAKGETEKGDARDRITMTLAELQMERYTGTQSMEDFLNSKFDSVVDNGDGTYTVTLDGYEAIIDSNGDLVGDIQKSGPRPVVDEASIKITTDGTTVPADNSLTSGTTLQIEFTASIEGGTITAVTPGTLASNKITYTTNGTEKEVTFTITGTVGGETRTSTKKISVASKYKIDHSEVVVPTITATGDLANNPKIAEVRKENIPIPAGFTYVKGDKIGGAVITDGTSEFVWVPVDTPSEMYGTDTNGKKWGKLYNFTSATTNEPYNWTETNGEISITSSTGCREPDVVSGYDGSTTYLNQMNTILGTNYTNSAGFKTDLETDFSNMITSVEKYKGFYVGRYETSLNASKVAQSKQGETSADANQTYTNRWYGLYARQKLYSTNSVQGSMIWGSQYDAMMKWMQGNGINVTSYTPTDLSIGATSRNKTRVTGGANSGQTVSKDKLSNIYDLLGNSYEWILEADYTYSRVVRGGYYSISFSPKNRVSGYYPYNTDSYFASRLALYVL